MALAAPFPAAGSARGRTRPASRSVTPHGTATSWSGARLTTRGRLVLMFASAAFLLLVIALSGRFTADAGIPSIQRAPATAVVVVQSGESLWQIASRLAPGSDPRALVRTIRSLNGLTDSSVVAGRSLLVPVLTGAS